MSNLNSRARERERPELPDPPFLCSHCHYGQVIVQKIQPWLLAVEAWQEGPPRWFSQATCRSPKVTPWKFTTFSHPVVECDAFRPRKLLTPEDIAQKQARKQARKEAQKAKRARKKRRKARAKRK